jgi:hypothetical protein
MVSMNSNFDEDGPLVKEDTPTKKVSNRFNERSNS